MIKLIFMVLLWLAAGCGGVVATTPSAEPLPAATSLSSPAAVLPTQPAATPDAPRALPMTWGGRGLSGHLLLILYHETGDSLIKLDLESGAFEILFQAPEGSRLNTAALSPDGLQLVLAYAPPKAGEIQLGYTDFYLLATGSTDLPRPLKLRQDVNESFFGPGWSPDGKTIVYAHFFVTTADKKPVYHYASERTDLNGNSETLIADSFWPVLSPDGSRLAYVSADLSSFNNDLYIADQDGKNAQALTSPGVTSPVDSHLFSPDGKTIYFSMVNSQTPPATSWWENLFGIKIVTAHSVPSDWYKVPAEGGKIERVTNTNDTGLYGAISPDGKHLAYISVSGLFVVNTDGSDLIQLSDAVFQGNGNIQWLP
jgi:Tol biopolymer transport system component